ncbi:MAG: glycosyltransferase family 2 protein [Candidatus Hodarchaeales archaeon]|jgi:glycosyltransferase involved in cell wall biosynthesis
MTNKILVGMPIFNEELYLSRTLKDLEPILNDYPSIDLLLFDDGSTDTTPDIIQDIKVEWAERVQLTRHEHSLGYGQTVIDILRYGCHQIGQYDIVITFDADLQHDPSTIPVILKEMEANHIDLVSSSRYLDSRLVAEGVQNSIIPYNRYLINMNITQIMNFLYNYQLTDSFCGLKGYRTCRVEQMFLLQDVGYSSPLEFWINAAYHDLFVTEIPTALIYLEDRRGRGSWRERFDSYMASFQHYAWAEDQRRYLIDVKSKIDDFIAYCLQENEKNLTSQSPIRSFHEFWNDHQNDSPFHDFKPDILLNPAEKVDNPN